MNSSGDATAIGAMAAGGAPSLRSLAIRGSIWTVGGYALSQLLRLGSNIVLAWLLFPEAFGLMLLVNVFMQGLQMFSDVGIGPSIIQNERGNDPAFLNTAWTIQVIRGVVLWIIACLLAWPVAWWFARNDPYAWQLLYILPVAGFFAVLAGFFSTKLFTLSRQLSMGRLILVHLASQVAGAVTMIVWALVDRSVWALVAGGLAAGVCKLWLSHAALPGLPNRFTWDGRCARALFHFGKWIFVSTAITFLALQIDRIMLGSLIPLQVLGAYSFALMVGTLPKEIIGHLTGTVLFPTISQHGRTNRETLPEKLLLARTAIVPTAGVMALAAALLAPLFFHLLYPAHYQDAGWMAQLISISVWISILIGSSDRALLAIGRTRTLATANVTNLLVTVIAALTGFHLFGVPGFIIGYAMGALACLLVVQTAMHREGMPTHQQDIRFTAILGVMAVLGLVGQELSDMFGGGMAGHTAVALTAVCGAAIWAARRSLPLVLKQ